MKLLRAVIANLAILLALAIPAWAQSKNLRQIVPGVWFRTGAPLIVGNGVDIKENSIIIEMKDYLLVVDSGNKSSAPGLLADCRTLSPKPVKYVFLTHHHFDHVGGNAFWTESGATTMAFAGVNEELDRQKSKDERVKQPITADTFVLDDGHRRVEFHHYGWAHTKGDGFVYLPKEKVLCTGDIVINAPYNSIFDAHLTNWPEVIRRMEQLDVQYVLPGHGQAGTKELMKRQREYLELLIAEVREAIQEGKKPEDLIDMTNGAPGKNKYIFPKELEAWASGPFSGRQVTDAYKQLSQEKN